MIQKKTGSIPSNENLPIRYDLYYPEDAAGELPVVLFLHGFKGFKDWGTFPEVCRQIAGEGFAVIAMNFSLNGIGENPLEFDRLDLFARETFSQDLDDVGTMLKAIKNGTVQPEEAALMTTNIGLLGHSRGGQTAVAAAAEYRDQVKGLVTWSAVADYNTRWSESMKNDWKTKGVTEIKNGRTGQIMPMKKVVYDDAREHADRVIALNRVDELQCPALFIHAKGDEAVSPKNAEQLYEVCSADKKDLMLLPGSGHTFDGAHPFEDEELPQPLRNAVAKTTKWFVDSLK